MAGHSSFVIRNSSFQPRRGWFPLFELRTSPPRGAGEAASNNRAPEGFTGGGRRSVDAAGDAHRETTPGRMVVGPRRVDHTLKRIRFATRNRRRRSGALQGTTRPRRGRLQWAPAGFTRGKTRGLSEATSNNGYPQGSLVEGVAPSTPRGRTPPNNAGRLDGLSATRDQILQRIGFATRNRRRRSGALQGTTRPRRGRLQWAPAGFTRGKTRGLSEATSNNTRGHPQGSRGAGAPARGGTTFALHRCAVRRRRAAKRAAAS
jgi:hypothetical protein